jgi:UDP-N-acetylbacillosamine N-acetyltransferase/acetyltransferase EpsM
MPEPIIVWGAGGHGRVVAEVALSAGFRVVGFVDADPRKLGSPVGGSGLAVVATERDFLDDRTTWSTTAVALGIGDNAARVRAMAFLPAALLPPLVHPSAVVSPTARLGAGTVVMPNVTVNADAITGEGVILNSGCIVEHDCRLATGVHVSPGAILAGAVCLEQESWVGAGATVIPGCSVGARTIIGAGSVVVSDVPPDSTFVGVPARAITRPS